MGVCVINANAFCVGSIQDIENYEKAVNDTTQTYVCHHRLETHTSDGERRKVDLSKEELLALDMYYHRPAEELIFLTNKEHMSLHNKGKKMSDDFCKKVRESMKGKNSGESHPFYGKHHTEEAKRKIAEANKGRQSPMKGRHHTEETKKKIREAIKRKIVNKKQVYYREGNEYEDDAQK